MAGGFVLGYSVAMTSEVFPRITVDPEVCFGKPCIRGMRVRVTDVLDMLAAGASRQEILADFPYLEDEDITAALSYAARTTDNKIAFAAE